MGTAADTLLKTPFHALHVGMGAKMVPFAGYEMPVQYPTGITAEHKAVREACGLFDVSHMGEFIVTGPQALEFVTYVTTNDVAALAVGQIHYSAILSERGTFEDDCLVYRGADHFMMVVNGSNKDKDLAHILKYKSKFDCTVVDRTAEIALLAVQGPKAQALLQPLVDVDLEAIKYYWFTEGTIAGVKATISRTGYTGEDGFELYFDADDAAEVWVALLATGGITPTGLGCRDSLRLEMGMALYGNDIDDTVTPLEAQLGWLVKMKKGDFVGRAALEQQKAAGVPRALVGFTSDERVFPRHGYPVFVDGVESGVVCSGTMSPSLGIPIGTCYVPAAKKAPGTAIEIDVRGKRIAARTTTLPFWTKGSRR
jgi:aminomethyltransferase